MMKQVEKFKLEDGQYLRTRPLVDLGINNIFNYIDNVESTTCSSDWKSKNCLEKLSVRTPLYYLSSEPTQSEDVTEQFLFWYDKKKFDEEMSQPTINYSSAYADRVNYYKRMLATKSWSLDNITEQQANQKLGYWEGRLDEFNKKS